MLNLEDTEVIRFIGIDTGSKGAIAVICGDNIIIYDLTNKIEHYWYLYTYLVDSQGSYDATVVYVEDVHGRPGQSCVANTTFMKLAGYAELLGFSIADSFNKVPPQTWKKYFGLTGVKGETKTQKKHRSIELAKKLFPSVVGELTASKDGRAEALLIAEYGRQQYEKENNNNKTGEDCKLASNVD